MGGYFILFLIFLYFFGAFKHCPGHRNGHAISRTIPDDPGRITCMIHHDFFTTLLLGSKAETVLYPDRNVLII